MRSMEPSDRAPRRRHVRLRIRIPRAVLVAILPLLAWSVLTLAGTFRREPVGRAMELVSTTAGWSEEEIYLLESSYGYRLLFSRFEARLTAGTPAAPRTAVVRMVYVPVVGWNLRSLAVDG